MTGKTYDAVLKFDKHPYKEKKSYVFTRRAPRQELCNVEFVSDLIDVTRDFVHSDSSKDILLVGDAEINSILPEASLIPKIIIAIHPTILGSGLPLFKGVRRVDVTLVDLVKHNNGLLQMSYQLS